MGWARYLKEQGWDPIVITRNWDNHIANPNDIHKDSGKELIHKTTSEYEAYYLPYKGNLRDRLYAKHGNNRFSYTRKALSLLELTGYHFNTSIISFSNLYYFALDYCKKNNDIQAIVVTGNPFEIFRFGYLLQKETGIPWIADYRDDWTTSDLVVHSSIIKKILLKLDQHSERKWIKSASCITSISPFYVKKIGAYVKQKGHVLLNGFFEEDFIDYKNLSLMENFTIVYNGMLYSSQQIEVFLDAIKKLVDFHPEHRTNIKLQFPGILFIKDVANRVQNYMKGYEDIIIMTERIPRKEVLELQARAHLLLMVSHLGSKGIPSSKIYEYLGLGRPVLVCPGDEDILDETFSQYNLGFIANTADEAYTVLTTQFKKYLDGTYATMQADTNYTAQFARSTQAKVLADLLNKVSE
jgi:glycosyltransferase involved in cell wall biosynthesis